LADGFNVEIKKMKYENITDNPLFSPGKHDRFRGGKGLVKDMDKAAKNCKNTLQSL